MTQGPVLGSLLLNIFTNDIFLFIETTILCNYVDGNTMYSSDNNNDIVISRHRHTFVIMSDWFYENFMVLNTYKFHFLAAGCNEPFPDFFSNDSTIENVIDEKYLRILLIDNKLNFKSHSKKYMQ